MTTLKIPALALALSCILRTAASAMLVPAAAPPAAALRAMQKSLEAKVLRQRLHELGLTDQEIQTRLKKLTDQQIHQLASRS
jgi:hypothetical protein